MGYIHWSLVFASIAVCFGAGYEYKCSTDKYTCNPKNLKEVTLENGMTIACEEKAVCNSEYQRPCMPCIESSADDEYDSVIVKKEVLSTNCNDGNGYKFPCRRHPTNRSLYIKCTHFMFYYQKSIVRCADFVKKESKSNCKLLDVCI